jgi:hypothetical protein
MKFDDLVKSQESRHSCESSPAFGGMDSRFRGNDENGTKRTFYESIKNVNFTGECSSFLNLQFKISLLDLSLANFSKGETVTPSEGNILFIFRRRGGSILRLWLFGLAVGLPDRTEHFHIRGFDLGGGPLIPFPVLPGSGP